MTQSIQSAGGDAKTGEVTLRAIKELRDELRMSFDNTAEWRSRKAAEHPDDNRNAEAARICEALAASVDDVDDALLIAYGEQFEDIDDSEAHQRMLADIGFKSWPESAPEFVREYTTNRQREKERLAT